MSDMVIGMRYMWSAMIAPPRQIYNISYEGGMTATGWECDPRRRMRRRLVRAAVIVTSSKSRLRKNLKRVKR